MSREHLFRTLECIPGVFLSFLGVFFLVVSLIENEWGRDTLIILVGSSVFAYLGVTHIILALRGKQQFFNRNPHPGPKVIIDDDGVHFTDRDEVG